MPNTGFLPTADYTLTENMDSTLHQIEEALHVDIVPGTEVMRDGMLFFWVWHISSMHLLKSYSSGQHPL
jgi:hypothetical protein